MMNDVLNYYSCLFPLYMYLIESGKVILFHIYPETMFFQKMQAEENTHL